MSMKEERKADFIYFPEYWESNAWKPIRLFKVADGVDNKYNVMCAEEPEHADGGLGRFYRKDRLQPFAERLWAACVAYVERRTQLLANINSEYNELAKGKIRLL